jgi:hypothetical protein
VVLEVVEVVVQQQFGEKRMHSFLSKLLVEIGKGKRLFGRPKHKWQNSIKLDLKEAAWEGVDWTHLA